MRDEGGRVRSFCHRSGIAAACVHCLPGSRIDSSLSRDTTRLQVSKLVLAEPRAFPAVRSRTAQLVCEPRRD